MNSSQTPEVEMLAQRRAKSRRIPYMEILDDMVTDIWKILKTEGPSRPCYKKPLPQVSEITYEQALSLTSALGQKLFPWGNLRGNEVEFNQAEFDENGLGRLISMPLVAQHLENRQGIKPDQPKTQDDAVAEANWLYAAQMMRGFQTYIKLARNQSMIGETYGMNAELFRKTLQKYVWMFLGKGSTEGLPWSGDPAWPTSRWTNPNYPDLPEVEYRWHAGFDLNEVLKETGPSCVGRPYSKNQGHEEDGNSLS